MSLYYISDSNWIHFLQLLVKNYSVYAPVAEGEHLYWHRIDAEKISGIVVNRYRALHPVKSFFFPVKEEVTKEPVTVKRVLVGLKACDLRQLLTTDAVFLEGIAKDPYYEAKRKNTLIISSDCSDVLPSCFCTLMGGKPYPEKGFDLNLTPVRHGFIVEVGSKIGEELVQTRKHLFQDPQPYHLKEREELRSRMERAVAAVNKDFTWQDPEQLMKEGYGSQKWEEDIAKNCVECDACRFACGSCYCFLLGEGDENWSKVRTWDSCQSAGYARTAGGGTPRKTKAQRLRNMYACKMLYRKQNLGIYACTGCGRCIQVCQGKIDIRKSLQKLTEKK
jgi:NAD-dependent dihydropyrimidine dehydrogenase PreA subunit